MVDWNRSEDCSGIWVIINNNNITALHSTTESYWCLKKTRTQFCKCLPRLLLTPTLLRSAYRLTAINLRLDFYLNKNNALLKDLSNNTVQQYTWSSNTQCMNLWNAHHTTNNLYCSIHMQLYASVRKVLFPAGFRHNLEDLLTLKSDPRIAEWLASQTSKQDSPGSNVICKYLLPIGSKYLQIPSLNFFAPTGIWTRAVLLWSLRR